MCDIYSVVCKEDEVLKIKEIPASLFYWGFVGLVDALADNSRITLKIVVSNI
jgi:hypothetical protein